MNEKLSLNFEADIHKKISTKNLYCAGGGLWVVGGGWTVVKKVLNFSLVLNILTSVLLKHFQKEKSLSAIFTWV